MELIPTDSQQALQGSRPPLKIGMIGLDTSHATQFTALLHDISHSYHVPGLQVVAAFPGGSPGFALSEGRLEKFTIEMRDLHGVAIVDRLEDLPADLDAILLESVDGRQHLAQFSAIAERGTPVFIDKPLACSSADAAEIAKIAAAKGVSVMSCSALRFAEALEAALAGDEAILGADVFGPMAFIEEMPGYFWYGIHTVEMLYRAMGPGCKRPQVASNDSHDVITAEWADGRLASVRGNRAGNATFGGVLHRKSGSTPFVVKPADKPFYARLMAQVDGFVQTGSSQVSLDESREIIRFLEAANESRAGKRWVDI